jgi:hypothetical protein
MFIRLIAGFKEGLNHPVFSLRMMMVLLMLAPENLISRPLPRGHHALVRQKGSGSRIFGSPLSGNLYARNRLGLRLSGKRIPWGSIQSPGLPPKGAQNPGLPPPPQGAQDFKILVNVDHQSILIISPTMVQWDHRSGARPGEHSSATIRYTELNGFKWTPQWSTPFGNRNPALSTPLSTTVYSSLLTSGKQITFTSQSVATRATTPPAIIQQPNANNSFTLKLDFRDDAPGQGGSVLFNVTFGL